MHAHKNHLYFLTCGTVLDIPLLISVICSTEIHKGLEINIELLEKSVLCFKWALLGMKSVCN